MHAKISFFFNFNFSCVVAQDFKVGVCCEGFKNPSQLPQRNPAQHTATEILRNLPQRNPAQLTTTKSFDTNN
jgi:hypothetical protein